MTDNEIIELVRDEIQEQLSESAIDYDLTEITLEQGGLTEEELLESWKYVYVMAVDYRGKTTIGDDGKVEFTDKPIYGNLNADGMFRIFGIEKIRELSEEQISQINQKFDEYAALHTSNVSAWNTKVLADNNAWDKKVAKDNSDFDSKVSADSTAWDSKVQADNSSFTETVDEATSNWEEKVLSDSDAYDAKHSESLAELDTSRGTALSEIGTAKDDALASMEEKRTSSIASIETKRAESVESVNATTDNSIEQMETIHGENMTELDGKNSQIQADTDSALQEIEDKKNEAISEVDQNIDGRIISEPELQEVFDEAVVASDETATAKRKLLDLIGVRYFANWIKKRFLNHYTKSEVDTLIANVNHERILNKGEVAATEATLQSVLTAYVQASYSREPSDLDAIIATMSDLSNDKVKYTYFNGSWTDTGKQQLDVAHATESTYGLVKLSNSVREGGDEAATTGAVFDAMESNLTDVGAMTAEVREARAEVAANKESVDADRTAIDGMYADIQSLAQQAESAKTQAESSMNNAQQASSDALVSATNAEESEGTAKDWATKMGSAVEGDEYSAKHHASKAKASEDNSKTSETNSKQSELKAKEYMDSINPSQFMKKTADSDLDMNGNNIKFGTIPIIDLLWPVGEERYFDNDTFNPNTHYAAIKGSAVWEKQTDGRFRVATGTVTDVNGNKGSFVLGQQSGELKHQITENELARHMHDFTKLYYLYVGGDKSNGTTPAGTINESTESYQNGIYCIDRTVYNNANDRGTSYSGGNTPMSILPPYLSVAVWIRIS